MNLAMQRIKSLPFILLFASFWLAQYCNAQQIFGTVDRSVTAKTIVLYGTRGASHYAMDSVAISSKGRFAFFLQKFPPGFYQLGVNDTDRVDIILDPNEPEVELILSGVPLQRNLKVAASAENQRMWAYKGISRVGYEKLNAISEERKSASPIDTALLDLLNRRQNKVQAELDKSLDSLIRLVPSGQFAFAVNIDRALDAVESSGPDEIKRVFNFSSPRLLRSSSYSKAIMLVLQRTPVEDEYSMQHACDSLLMAADRDTACWNYTRAYLIELFATYGPDDLAQYLVDEYVVGAGAMNLPNAALLELAAAQLRLVKGAPAPDVELARPGEPDTLHLSGIWPDHDLTTLFFYSSTCDHCHHQMPGLRQLVLDYDPAKFHLIGIALDHDTLEFPKTLLEFRVNWPCYTMVKSWGDPAAKAFNVKATPSFFVIDRAGRIVAKPMDHEELRAFLVKYFKQ